MEKIKCKHCGKDNIEIEASIMNKKNNVIYCKNCCISYICPACVCKTESKVLTDDENDSVIKKSESAWSMIGRLALKINKREENIIHYLNEYIPEKYKSMFKLDWLSVIRWIMICPEQEAIKIMQEIEKELRDEY